jgi:hypothetical protein
MKMEQTECSETSAYKIQKLRNYPEENIQQTEHGESLKSRIVTWCVSSPQCQTVIQLLEVTGDAIKKLKYKKIY